jgi:hypothetical protein
MLTHARDKDWEQVQEIEQQRQKLLDGTFPLDESSVANNPSVLAWQIQKIADLDKETMFLMSESKKELSDTVKKISSGRQAVSAYQDIQSR